MNMWAHRVLAEALYGCIHSERPVFYFYLEENCQLPVDHMLEFVMLAQNDQHGQLVAM